MVVVNSYSFFKGPAGNREAYFQEHLEKIGTITRTEKGCLQYDYFFAAERKDMMLIVERWDCQADLDAHLASDHLKKAPTLRAKYGVTNQLNKYEAE